jgi:hypothetical protein
MFEIKRYCKNNKSEWNQFVENSKNGTFLFNRNYMDYHSDKFEDYSLMVYRKNKLYSVLPANKNDDILYSHQGLTYGGFVMSKNVTTKEFLDVSILVFNYLKNEGFQTIIYKSTPYIYHKNPSQEDLYALFKHASIQLIGCNISSTIYQSDKIKFIESRKAGIRKAEKNNIIIKESGDFCSFWEILTNNLNKKYQTSPVHSLEEIVLLHSRFPQNIKLYMAYKNDIPIGGSVLYLMKNVVHTQYISATLDGKECGALDLLFDVLINNKFIHIPVFDFGQSTENMGTILNESLIFQKEGFGGRGVVYNIYEIKL